MRKNMLLKLFAGFMTFSLTMSDLTGAALAINAAESESVVTVDETVESETEAAGEAAETEEVAESEETWVTTAEEEPVIEDAAADENVEKGEEPAVSGKEEEKVVAADAETVKCDLITDSTGKTVIGIKEPEDAEALIKLEIPSTVTKIKKISDNDKVRARIVEVDFSNATSLTVIDTGAFKDTKISGVLDLTKTKLDEAGESSFEKCEGITEVRFPKSITKIGVKAFADDSAITKLEFIASGETTSQLEMIGNEAFDSCEALESLDFSKCDSLRSIGEYAFWFCKSLNSVKFNKNLESIQWGAFGGCINLPEVTFESGFKALGGFAFAFCTNLKKVTINSNSMQMDSVTNTKTTTIKNGTKYDNSIMTTYQAYAFWGCSLNKIVYGEDENGVKINAIPKALFAGATFVIEPNENDERVLTIDECITNIGAFAFAACSGVDVIDMAPMKGEAIIEERAFEQIPSLTALYLPQKLARINDKLCYKDTSLKVVMDASRKAEGKNYLPKGITSIGESAFEENAALESIILPDEIIVDKQPEYSGLTKIGTKAFYKCTSLGKVQEVDGKPVDNVMVIPRNIAEIGDEAFSGCKELKKVVFTDALEEKLINIPKKCFMDCGLTEMELPDGITVVKESAFENCKDMAVLKLDDNLKEIEKRGFYNCSSLTELELSDIFDKFGDSAFENCSSLIRVNWKNALTEIGSAAFKGCTDIENEEELPNTVKTIKGEAFSGCTSIEKIYIPTSVTSVGNKAFMGCSRARTIDFHAEKCADFGKNGQVFSGVNDIRAITFAEGVTNIPAYFLHEAVIPYSIKIDIPYSVISIGAFAFNNGKNSYADPMRITELKFVTNKYGGTQIEKIGEAAFRWTEIANFDIPDTVKTMGNYALAECKALATATIGVSLKEIPEGLFYKDGSLTKVGYKDNAPAIITKIGSAAFSECTALTMYDVPDTVTLIDSRAFAGDTALATLYIPKNAVVGNEVIEGAYADLVVYTPAGSKCYDTLKGLANHDIKTDDVYTITYFGVDEYENGAGNATGYYKGMYMTFANPYKEGFVFKGWYTDPEFKPENEIKHTKDSTGDLVLYPLFSDDWTGVEYTVTFISNHDGADSPDTINVKGAEEVTLPVLTARGYDFLGWDTIQAGNGKRYEVGTSVSKLVRKSGDNVILYGQWKPKEAKSIKYNLNGGKAAANTPGKYFEDADTPTSLIGFEPTKDKCIFEGWYTNKDFTGDPITGMAGQTGNVELFAKWKIDWSQVVYTVQYVTADGVKSVDNVEITGSTELTLPTAERVARDGYIMKGWLSDQPNPANEGKKDIVYEAGATVKELVQNTTSAIPTVVKLTAQYEKKQSYKINYKLNGGTYDNAPSAYVTDEPIAFGAAVKDKCTFEGWYLDDKFTEKITTTAGMQKEITVYAHFVPNWSQVTYKVEFAGNDVKLEPIDVAGDAIIKLPSAEKVTRRGYILTGWQSDQPSKTIYKEGSEVRGLLENTDKALGNKVKLTAVWVKDETLPEGHAIISYDLGADDAVIDKQQLVRSYPEGEKMKITGTPTRVGYKFSGWYDLNTGKKAKITKETKGDLKLQARWKPCAYTVMYYATSLDGGLKPMAKQKVTLTKTKLMKGVPEKKLIKNMVDTTKFKGFGVKVTTEAGTYASEEPIIVNKGTHQGEIETRAAKYIEWTQSKNGKSWSGIIKLYPLYNN